MAPFLEARKKEAVEIMVTLFDQEKVMEIHDYHIAEAARQDGLQEGRAEGRAEIARNLLKMGLSMEQIVSATGLTQTELERLAQ